MKAVKFEGHATAELGKIWVIVDHVGHISQMDDRSETVLNMVGGGKISVYVPIDDVMTRLGFNTGGG